MGNMAEALIEQGNAFFTEGQYLKAAGAFSKACKLAPENAELHCNLAFALLKENKFTKALTAAETAISLDGTSEKAHFRRALALAALERWDDAVPALIATKERQPSSTNKEVSDMLALAKWRCKSAHLEADTPVPEESKKDEEPEEEKEAMTREQQRQRLAEIQAAQQSHRTRKYNKKVMAKKAAQATAEKELVTKEMINSAKRALAVDKAVEARANELTTDKVFEEKQAGMKQGEKVAYDSERIERFAAVELKGITDTGDRATFKEPIAIVLPGVRKEGWGDEG